MGASTKDSFFQKEGKKNDKSCQKGRNSGEMAFLLNSAKKVLAQALISQKFREIVYELLTIVHSHTLRNNEKTLTKKISSNHLLVIFLLKSLLSRNFAKKVWEKNSFIYTLTRESQRLTKNLPNMDSEAVFDADFESGLHSEVRGRAPERI